MWHVIIWISVWSTLAEIPTDEELQQLPNCGIGSAWTILRLSGQTCRIEELSARFRDLGVDNSESVNMLDLRRVLESYGLATHAARISPARIRSVDVPGILYFRPGRWKRTGSPDVGHFVVLTGFENDDAILVDWTALGITPQRKFALDKLVAKWDGEVILLGGDSAAVSVASWAVVCIVALSTVVFLRRKRATSNVATGLLLMGCLWALGCSPSAAPTKPGTTEFPIAFESPMVDLGVLELGASKTQAFVLRTWDRGPVRIKKIETSCACSVADTKLTGRELAPNSRHELALRIQAVRAYEGKLVFAKVETVPPASSTISVGVRFRTFEPPRPHQDPFIVETIPGARPTAELVLTARRTLQDPVTVLKGCRSEEFELLKVTTNTKHKVVDASGTRLSVDELRAVLQLRQGYAYGEHPGLLKFQWGNGRESELATFIRVKPPGIPLSDRLFCGVLEPGAEWKLLIPLRDTESVEARIHSVRFAQAQFTATLQDRPRAIRLIGNAPHNAGRFSDTLIVTFGTRKYPEYRVQVTGVVRESAAK